MENICVAEASRSSDPSCDERVSEISSLAQVTSNHMAATSRPCDPRDFKKSRAYQFKALDQNTFQLDHKVTQERSTFALDRSILTPITDGDQVNDIKMTASLTDECDVVVSEEAVVDLAIDNRVDMSMPEVIDMVLENMDVGDSKKEDSTTEGNKKEDSLTRLEGVTEEQDTKAEDITQSNAVLAEDKVERTKNVAVAVQDKTEEENRKEDTIMVVEDKMEAEDRKDNTVVMVEDKMEAENRKKDTIMVVEDKMEAEDRKEDTIMVVKDKMEAEDRKENTVVMVEDKIEAEENIKEDSMIILEDKTEEKESVVEVEKEEEKVEAVEDRKENNVMVEARVEDDVVKHENKDDKMEVDTVKEKDDKMEVEESLTENFKTVEHMDTTLNVDSSNKLSPANSALTASKIRVKSELFCFNPEPIDDDLSLPSCNELSNQVLSNNFLRDIENLSDSVDSQLPIGPSISKVLSKPLIPSCSAFRSSVLSNVTSTVRSGSGSSLSVSGRKQSLKDTTFVKSPRKGSSPRKIVSKTSEKSVSKKLVSKRNSESSSEGERAATTAVETKPIKPKPVVEQVRKYTTRRAALLEETKQVENKPQAKPASSIQEKLPVRDTKPSPHKHTNLQSSSHKDKSLSKPPQLDIKTSKQNRLPSKTPKSPSKTTPTRTLPTRQSTKLKLSPCTPSSSTSPSTKSHTKTIAKATVSSTDPIPVWITWKCCLCSRGSSQDQLGFLYGPYKSQTDDCVSVGSKRTHDDTDSDSVDEKPTVSKLWVHEGCACWAPGVCLVGSELHGLAEAVKNAKDMECVGCHQPGATISCSNRGCKASFHYPCAIKAGCSLLPDQLLLLCQTHNTQEKTV